MAAPGQPGLIVANPSIPAHFGPRVLTDDIGTVSMVDYVVAHPLRERHVVRNKTLVVSACGQPPALRFLGGVEQADGQVIETIGRWCGEDFAGRNRIATEQEMPPLALTVKRAAHQSLHH